tara:strand:- start:277 stop:1074 length:798 start_codon:yes stop_codon:yes gene_type:complete
MIEKVNPQHPDKIADRIAGALVDYAYTQEENPKIAVEVLIGHGYCTIISETTVKTKKNIVDNIVKRIAGDLKVNYIEVPQDVFLNGNQSEKTKAGDNGIFKGIPIDNEVKELSQISRSIYKKYPTDGKYILDKKDGRLIVCQSNALSKELKEYIGNKYNLIVNPLGHWIGGIDVDSGATNRKLGSDMGRAVTGGGLHGKDLSKADVSVNIYAHLKAQKENKIIDICCAIGDDKVDGKDYSEIVKISKDYINSIGGFEKFAEWGII